MRKSDAKPLKAAIEEFIDSFRLRDKLSEAKVLQAWGKTVGPMVEKNTRDLHIRNRILYVKVDSSALRNELLFARTKILNGLNKAAGSRVIDEIVIQ